MADITARAILIDEMSKKLRAIESTFKKTGKSIKGQAKQTNEELKSMKDKIVSVKGAFVGLAVVGVGAFAKSIVKAGAEMESLETKFKVLLGDTESAKARMQELSKFAQTTPFQLTEVANASRVLQTLGGTALATGESLRLVGDASAISGASFENLAIHVGRAYSGLQSNRPIGESMARLQELGLVSGETRNKIEDLTKSAKGKEAWKILEKELQKSNGGMKELSGTLTGLTSTFKDQLAGALRQMGQGGLFDSIKSGLSSMVQGMNNLLESGFFQRMGSGFNFLSGAFGVLTRTIDLGVSSVLIAFNEMINGVITGARKIMNALPDSLVPDGWKESLNNANITFDTFTEKMLVGMEESREAMDDNLIQMAKGWKGLVNGIPIELYKEKVKEASKVNTQSKEKKIEENEELLKADADFYEQLSLQQKEAKEKELEVERATLKAKEDLAKKEADIFAKKIQLSQSMISSLSTISQNALGKDKKNAKKRQMIAYAEAIVNTGLGVTKALSVGDIPESIAIGLMGGAQVSTIGNQKFNQGGIVKSEGGVSDIGDKTMIRVNAGEGVFTKEQMKAMGNQAPITIAPAITINGNADSSAVESFGNNLQEMSNMIIEAIRGNYLDLNNELNLVTQ